MKVSMSCNRGPVRQGSELVSRMVQERVQKLFDLDYNSRNWSSLLYSGRCGAPGGSETIGVGPEMR